MNSIILFLKDNLILDIIKTGSISSRSNIVVEVVCWLTLGIRNQCIVCCSNDVCQTLSSNPFHTSLVTVNTRECRELALSSQVREIKQGSPPMRTDPVQQPISQLAILHLRHHLNKSSQEFLEVYVCTGTLFVTTVDPVVTVTTLV